MVGLRVPIVTGHFFRPPDVAEVDAGTGHHAVGFPGAFLRRKDPFQVAAVRIGRGNGPTGLPLRDIGHGRVLQDRPAIHQHPLFKVQEVLPGRAFVGQDRAEIVEILVAAAPPGAVRQGEHGGVQVILFQDVLFVGEISVIPEG